MTVIQAKLIDVHDTLVRTVPPQPLVCHQIGRVVDANEAAFWTYYPTNPQRLVLCFRSHFPAIRHIQHAPPGEIERYAQLLGRAHLEPLSANHT